MTWNVDPIIVQWGRLTVSWYGLFFAAGFFGGLQIMQWIYRREGRPVQDLERLLWYVMAGTLIGMRLAHCLIYEPEYYLAHPWEIPQIWLGGYASHGGAVGLLIAVALYCRAAERPHYLWLLDRICIPATLAGASIRIGNFFNSEIVGYPTSSPLGVVFKRLGDQPLHPVQLYEAVAYLIIFGCLLFVYRRYRSLPDGMLTGIYFITVFSARFGLEFLKTPQAAYEQGMVVHVGQYLSLPFVLLGAVLVLRARGSAVRFSSVRSE